jgi:hypothetical protein
MNTEQMVAFFRERGALPVSNETALSECLVMAEKIFRS